MDVPPDRVVGRDRLAREVWKRYRVIGDEVQAHYEIAVASGEAYVDPNHEWRSLYITADSDAEHPEVAQSRMDETLRADGWAPEFCEMMEPTLWSADGPRVRLLRCTVLTGVERV